MKPEIERKFLVKGEFIQFAVKSESIIQGFISEDPKRSVRIRIKDNKGFITIKGESDKTGVSRLEFEKEIELSEADELMNLCKGELIKKIRYIIPFKNHIFEVDIFEGKNKGLVIAEIELKNIHEEFEKPDWLSKEVTGDIRYYNLYLSKNPYMIWSENARKINNV